MFRKQDSCFRFLLSLQSSDPKQATILHFRWDIEHFLHETGQKAVHVGRTCHPTGTVSLHLGRRITQIGHFLFWPSTADLVLTSEHFVEQNRVKNGDTFLPSLRLLQRPSNLRVHKEYGSCSTDAK